MSTTPKQIKSKSYDVERKNGFPVDDGFISYQIDNFDDSGKLVERIWTDEFYRSAEDIIWKYEYDEKGRLVSIEQIQDPVFIEYHTYDTDEYGNDVEIVSVDSEDPMESGYDTVRDLSIRDSQGRLLAQWRLYEMRDMDKTDYAVADHFEFVYNENGTMSEVIKYGHHKLDELGNIEDATEVDRYDVTVEESEDRTVTTWKNSNGEIALKETKAFIKDCHGKTVPKEYILEKEGNCHSHIEYEYPDDSAEHYITYESNSFEYGFRRTEYWEES